MQHHSSEQNLKALERWANALACPACFASLRADCGKMLCVGCGRLYPVIDGVPILISDRAENPQR
jgi:uncharacterized protein YbaR (Trm112 family)